ncbi:hypothetical protein HDU96_007308 [Phlyctochytrium bullatum]|nr:hypothetical protein HDU96_007308 [Phlyctochytrium bullatum]
MVHILLTVLCAALAATSIMAAPAPVDWKAKYPKPAGYDQAYAKHMQSLRTLQRQLSTAGPRPALTATDTSPASYVNDLLDFEAKLPDFINEVFGPGGPGDGIPDGTEPIAAPVDTNSTEPAPALVRRGGGSNKVVVQGSGVSAYNDVLTQYGSFAAASYCSTDSLKAWNCKTCQNRASGTSNVTVFEDGLTGMRGFVGYNARLNTIVVSFRGSSNIQNWIQNLAFLKVDADVPRAPAGVSVHFGFQNTANAVYGSVQPAVSALLRAFPSATVTFTGHSLGGAVATMSAIQLGTVSVVPLNKIRLVTFGSPRVGNRAFYAWVRNIGFAQSLRGVNYNDLVPHLPPTPLGFRHVIEQQWIDSTGRTNFCDDLNAANNGEDTNCANSTFPWYSAAPHNSYFSNNMGGNDC